jgi:hypothetical protein
MKITIKVTTEVEVKYLQVKAEVRYWEDSEINGETDTENGDNVPCKNGDLWTPEIEIETGKILNWKQGVEAKIYYKICDCCGWELKNEKGDVVLSAEDGYVPSTLCPKESGYGDYIIMDIDKNGVIADWNFEESDFQDEEEE